MRPVLFLTNFHMKYVTILNVILIHLRYSTPQELLDLLIARFNIPEPEFSSDSESDSDHHGTASGAASSSAAAAAVAEKTSKVTSY